MTTPLNASASYSMASSSSSPSRTSPKPGSPTKANSVRHPLLSVSAARNKPASLPSPSKTDFAASPSPLPSKSSSPVSIAVGSASSRRSSQALPPLQAAMARDSMRLSIDDDADDVHDHEESLDFDVCGDDEEEEHDADRIEADLRFPTFARRTDASLAQRRRTSSWHALDHVYGDIDARGVSKSPEEERGRARVREEARVARRSTSNFDSFTTACADVKSRSEVFEEEDALFSLEDDDEARPAHGMYSYLKARTYSIATTDTTGTATTATGDGDDVEAEPSSGSANSLTYSSSYRSGARRTSERSSADLDMIWDEEESEEQPTTANTSLVSPLSSDGSEDGRDIKASKTKAVDMTPSSQTRSNARSMRAGSWQSGTQGRQLNGVPPVVPSSTTTAAMQQYGGPRLPFARRPSELASSTSSNHFAGRRRQSTSASQAVSPFLGRSRSIKQQAAKGSAVVADDASSPSLTHLPGLRRANQSSPEAMPAAQQAGRRLSTSSSSHSVSSMATMRGKMTPATSPLVYGRKRSSTDPLAGVAAATDGGMVSPPRSALSTRGTQDTPRPVRVSSSPFVSLPATPLSRQPASQQDFLSGNDFA